VLSAHGLVLVHIARQPDATTRTLAEDLGLGLRWVYAILGDLEKAGMIRRTRLGRRTRYRLNPEASLRHPYLQTSTLDQFLQAFAASPDAAATGLPRDRACTDRGRSA
jgi:DNA-binding MarR family transcriptional regulator